MTIILPEARQRGQPRVVRGADDDMPVAVNAAGEKLSKQRLATAIDALNPVPPLVAALCFLGHAPPRKASGGISSLWRWAIANWRLERVPRIRTMMSNEE